MPSLKLPNDGRSSAFRGLAAILQSDPNLRRLGILWVLPDSPDFDNDPPKDRIYVRLWPHLLPEVSVGTSGGNVRIYESPIDLEFTLRVPSWQWDDTPNLWSAIESALMPGTSAGHDDADARLADAGVSWVESPQGPPEMGPDSVGVGRLTIVVHIER